MKLSLPDALFDGLYAVEGQNGSSAHLFFGQHLFKKHFVAAILGGDKNCMGGEIFQFQFFKADVCARFVGDTVKILEKILAGE
ncbi:MAG: hypothetical protein P8X55_10350 [Desulfosarcinaceae bacterium]